MKPAAYVFGFSLPVSPAQAEACSRSAGLRGVPEDRAKRDLHAAFEFLASQPNLKKDRIGAFGWCRGGGYAFDIAVAEPTLAAAVINYGHLATDPKR